jgi:hypothetical protein
LTEKIQTLTPEQLVAADEVATRCDFSLQSQTAFGAIWNNPEDDVYDLHFGAIVG